MQWLGLRASTAGDMGSIPGQGIKISNVPSKDIDIACSNQAPGQPNIFFFFKERGLFGSAAWEWGALAGYLG